MTKKIGLIINMPTEQALPEEIEKRRTELYNLLARWAFEAYLKEKSMEDMFKGLELTEVSSSKSFDEL